MVGEAVLGLVHGLHLDAQMRTVKDLGVFE